MTDRKRATLRDFAHRIASAEQDIVRMESARDQWRAAFGKVAAELRQALGMSQTEMARRLGCSKAMLHDLEHGRRWSDRIASELRARLEPNGKQETADELFPPSPSSVEPSRIPCFAR